MSKFLQQVAEYYVSTGTDMRNMIMVFPNRRSAMFMRKYLKSAVTGVSFMPRMVSITYFTQSFNDTVLAPDDELLFILYKVYCRLLEKHGHEKQIPTFDSFSFWGSIILNDFSDVDAYLADPAEIFSNLRSVKEISANYLTKEQLDAIQLLWGSAAVPQGDIDRFWKHFPDEPEKDSLSDKFLSLWMILGELYEEFNKEIASMNPPLAYSGLQSRAAFKKVAAMGVEDFNGRRYAFIGFNVLSLARISIFRRLKDLGIAEFFWDTAPLEMIKNLYPSKAEDPASAFIKPLSKEFPSPDGFTLDSPAVDTDIEIISVPSNSAQVKVAGDIIKEWHDELDGSDDYTMAERMLDTCMVLPDDKLLIPLLYSLPPDVKPINVTMGLRYTSTSFAALLSAITSMHMRARKQRDDYHYYYQDVVQVMMHPHISAILSKTAVDIINEINSHHLFRISSKTIVEKHPEAAFIFKPVEDPTNLHQVRDYVVNLLTTLSARLTDLTGSGKNKDYYEIRILDGYLGIVRDICALAEKYAIDMGSGTFFRLLEKALSRKTLDFIGKPLKGLQIMGVMDTRSLDFADIVMLSMNEGIFPQRNYTPSLIPATLRHGYMMPTQEEQESTYAYQFFRLISRARRVRLIHDSRTKGLAAGEMSRYLSQLLHLHKDKRIRFSSIELHASTPEQKSIVIDKTPEVVEELRGFRPGGNLFLSASALKTYIKCPLWFYLQYVKGIRVNENIMEYIDAASYGTVLHALAQGVYEGHEGETITSEFIDNAIKENDFASKALDLLNEFYYRNAYTGRLQDIPGEGKIIARILSRYITAMLEKEKQLTPFTFVGAEVGDKKKFVWRVNDKYTVNLRMSVDRIDRKPDGTLRFIDYKTGNDALEVADVEQLFTKEDKGGIFQLLTYCHAYADIFGESCAIQPVIYKFKEIASKGISALKFRKEHLLDYRVSDTTTAKDPVSFFPRFEEMIDAILEEDNAHPFTQTEDIDNCRYCPFAQMCGRYPESRS